MRTKKPPAASYLPHLAAPASRALSAAGVVSLASLARMSEPQVMSLHGMGPDAMSRLKAAMKAKGIAFAKR